LKISRVRHGNLERKKGKEEEEENVVGAKTEVY
jgi:hypothetical protein